MNRALIATGSYKGITGHDHHTRSIVRAMHQRGIEIELRDIPDWSPAKLPESYQNKWFDTLQKTVGANVHLHFCMPHQVQAQPGLRHINYTMFEADRVPESWVRLANHHDLVVVPVESCRRAWINSGLSEQKVVVCPLGVDAAAFKPGLQPLSVSAPDGRKAEQFRVRLLNICDVVERKNLLGLLRAWLVATNERDDAVLLLKAGFHRPGSAERFLERLHELTRVMGKPLQKAAPIIWIKGTIAPDDMPCVFASATHYISVSRGEGFDLPMVEAGASGLQLIAPKHTAYLDYLNDSIAHLIPASLQEVRTCGDTTAENFFAGAMWWEPDHDRICSILRGIIDGQAECKQSARAALSELSWSQTAERLETLSCGL